MAAPTRPTGLVVKISGISDATCTRERLGDSLCANGSIAQVDFSRGDTVAFLRMKAPSAAQELAARVASQSADFKAFGSDLSAKVLSSDEETEYYASAKRKSEERLLNRKRKRGAECSMCKTLYLWREFSSRQRDKGVDRKCRKCMDLWAAERQTKSSFKPSELTCKVCKTQFKSRNKLFKHIRAQGHDAKVAPAETTVTKKAAAEAVEDNGSGVPPPEPSSKRARIGGTTSATGAPTTQSLGG